MGTPVFRPAGYSVGAGLVPRAAIKAAPTFPGFDFRQAISRRLYVGAGAHTRPGLAGAPERRADVGIGPYKAGLTPACPRTSPPVGAALVAARGRDKPAPTSRPADKIPASGGMPGAGVPLSPEGVIRMANYTAHYQLHQWEPEDSFLRTDFNEDFAKIDGALGGKAEQSAVDTLAEQVAGKSELVTGSYTGDGEASRTIELGFSPKAVLLASGSGPINYTSSRYGGLALEGAEVNTDWESTSGEPVLRVVTGGFQVFYDYDEEVFSNSDRDRYHYLALR